MFLHLYVTRQHLHVVFKALTARMKPDHKDGGQNQKREQDFYLGCLTKKWLIMLSTAVGLLILVIIIVPVVILTRPGTKAPVPLFPTDGDMLDFLVQSGEISEQDGLLATWFHRANSKEQMNMALASDVMILEADVTLEGYGTPDQNPVPIMAHPPDVYSDNTLDQWLDAVLDSRKGIKLDFKALDSVGFSLDLLKQKNSSRGINRPVWLNADILRGPNVPNFVSPVNGTRFLQLIQKTFPDVTLSPGWMVLYIPQIAIGTYSKEMVENMYHLIKDVPQKVTFPVHALLVHRGWQHISWLLNQSPRFSLTLWQGSDHPTVRDLLFVRDNTQPAQVYYDIYEPTLTAFKEAARNRSGVRRFYPGGNLMDFLYPVHNWSSSFLTDVTQRSSLGVRWFSVADEAFLLARLSDEDGGMLVLHVVSDRNQPGVPVLGGSGTSSEPFTLQRVFELLGQRTDAPWGVYLRVHGHQLLEASLKLLQAAYSAEELYRPIWISMESSQSSYSTNDFVSTVEELFPYVTVVLAEQNWPPLIPASLTGLSQRLAVHLTAASLLKEPQELPSLKERNQCDFVVEVDMEDTAETFRIMKKLMAQQGGKSKANLYMMTSK
ncbi:protein FAM151A isoform X1 [Xiphophorus hellerii]|uniref:protein FAM151A isoform X1 n=2 Tax=Xiphophorus hellerii TaxID=8084 RepID=UPI0013B3A598|nr:protein FAM151A isoform X1 [Xiphophorus hellerii]